jgi:hypothetical protein
VTRKIDEEEMWAEAVKVLTEHPDGVNFNFLAKSIDVPPWKLHTGFTVKGESMVDSGKNE